MNIRDLCRSRNFRTTEDWHHYFRSNRNVLEVIPWEEARPLSDDERSNITRSIQDFQLAENGEGKHLSEFAKDHSERTNDPLYYETIKFFIREEQRHAQVLGRFMDFQGIPRAKKSFLSSAFRHLRRYAGLEVSITVLLMAEIVGLVFYRTLRDATSSSLLKKICHELLKDESVHLRFHFERLAIMQENTPFRAFLFQIGESSLLLGTSLFVWWSHRKVLSVDYSFTQYLKKVWKVYRIGLRKKSLGKVQANGNLASSRVRNSLILRLLRPQSRRPTRVRPVISSRVTQSVP